MAVGIDEMVKKAESDVKGLLQRKQHAVANEEYMEVPPEPLVSRPDPNNYFAKQP